MPSLVQPQYCLLPYFKVKKMKEYKLKSTPADRADSYTHSQEIYRNPHARENVNVPQGPRLGMAGAHEAKRGNFKAAKAERQPLADMVTGSFARRGRSTRDEESPGLEPIKANSKEKFKTKR